MISLLSEVLSRVVSSPIVRKHQFFSAQPCFTSPKTTGKTLTSLHDHQKNHSFDYMDFCGQSGVSAFEYSKFVIAFLSRRKCLLISWLQSLSSVILEPKNIFSFMGVYFCLSKKFLPSCTHPISYTDITLFSYRSLVVLRFFLIFFF